MVSVDPELDAYEYVGSLSGDHPAVLFGLTGTTSDDDIDTLVARMLLHFGPPPFDPLTLGPALATWRDDMREMGE